MYQLSEAQRQELARIADEASVEFVREARSEGTPEMALENAFLPFVQRIAESAHADGCRETVERAAQWVVIADGEGADIRIVYKGEDLRRVLHDFWCVCGLPLNECGTENIAADIARMDEVDAWECDEDGERFSITWEHECGSVTLYRLRALALDAQQVKPSAPTTEEAPSGAFDVDKLAQAMIDSNPGAHLSAAYRAVALSFGRQLQDRASQSPDTAADTERERKPDGYAHQYSDGAIRFNEGEMVNGSSPVRAVPYYLDTEPKSDVQEIKFRAAEHAIELVADRLNREKGNIANYVAGGQAPAKVTEVK